MVGIEITLYSFMYSFSEMHLPQNAEEQAVSERSNSAVFISISNPFWVTMKYPTVTVFNSNGQKQTKLLLSKETFLKQEFSYETENYCSCYWQRGLKLFLFLVS